MKFFLLFFLYFLSLISCEYIFPTQNNVIVLDDKTFGYSMRVYKYMLVFFYTDNCEECKTFLPEYEKIASEILKENIATAKIDARAEPVTAQTYKVNKYPTIILFIKGNNNIINYTGKFNKEELLDFVKQKSEPKFKILTTDKELEEYTAKHEAIVVYFGNNPQEKYEYTLAERKILDVPFALVESKELISKYTKSDSLVTIFKKFDELRNDLTEIKSEKIINFVENYSVPKITNFDTKTAPIVFTYHKPTLVVFADKNSEEFNQYKFILYPIADKYLGKIKVMLTDANDGLAIKLAELMGVHDEDMPTVRIIEASDKIAKKYLMKGEINEKNILNFVENWENKKLKEYFKTEEIPEYNDREVFILVGKSFKKEVLSNDKDVLVLFFAPWCKYCKEFYPKYEELARKIKDRNPNLLIAKMDVTENDVEGFPINNFPSVEFYPGNKKNQLPLHFPYKKGINELIKFVKENAFHKVDVEGVKIEEQVLFGEKNEEL